VHVKKLGESWRPWENPGKTMGKPWENHGKTMIYMENHRRLPGFIAKFM